MALTFQPPRRARPLSWRRWAWLALVFAAAILIVREFAREPEKPGLDVPVRRAQSGPGQPLASADVVKLPDEAWKSVRDDTVFRSDEHEAFYGLLSQLAARTPQELQAASEGVVGFLPLSQQMADYRGQVVTVAGVARRAKVVKAEPNDFGIRKFFQVWVRPQDTTAGPIVLYALELPANFPTGNEIEEPIEAEGVVLKRWAYSALDGTRTSPLLLAKGLRWDPNHAPLSRAGSPNWLLVIGAAAAISASAVFWIWRSSPQRRKRPSETLSP